MGSCEDLGEDSSNGGRFESGFVSRSRDEKQERAGEPETEPHSKLRWNHHTTKSSLHLAREVGLSRSIGARPT